MNPIFEKLQNEIARSIEDLDARQMQLSPANGPDKWTIQQIIQHLCLTYSSTDSVVSDRLNKGRPTQAVPTVPQRCMQIFVTRLNFFPLGREAPSVVMPPQAPASSGDWMSGAMLAAETASHLAEMDQLLEKAQSHFGSTRFASHSVLGPLNAALWRRFHLVHGRHHLKQVWVIRHQHMI
jgi:hypothetical protein